MKLRSVVLVALSAVGGGLAPIFLKLAEGQGAAQTSILFIRFAVSSLLLLAIVLRGGAWKSLDKRDLQTLLLACLGGGALFGLMSLLLFGSMHYISAGVGEVLYFTYPVWVGLAGIVLFGQRLYAAQWGLLGLMLCGIAMTLDLRGTALQPKGILLALASSLVGAVYVLFCKMPRFRPFAGQLMGLSVMAGAALVFGIRWLLEPEPLPPVTGKAFAIICAMALVCTLMAMVCYFSGIGSLAPIEIAALATLEPVITLAAETLLLKKAMAPLVYAGAALIILAITCFVIYKPKPKRGPSAAATTERK